MRSHLLKGDTYLVANQDTFKKIEVSALIAGEVLPEARCSVIWQRQV
ncbi:MAG: hypothetical protein ACLUOS_15570 [Odoribacter splanchnicus]